MTPLALSMLVHFHTHAPDDAFPDLRANLMDLAWLLEEGIVEDVGEEGELHFSLTGRGVAWLEMILATPLPVQQWSDPRSGEAAKADTADRFLAAIEKLADRPAPVARRTTGGHVPKLPNDFIPWSGGDNPLVPPTGSTTPMHDVIVAYSSGKVSKKMPAQSVVWQHKGGDFDVIGYKAIPVTDAVPAS
jgi:hypothetical protein